MWPRWRVYRPEPVLLKYANCQLIKEYIPAKTRKEISAIKVINLLPTAKKF